MVVVMDFLSDDKAGLTQEVVAIGRAAADVGRPDGGVPDPKGDLDTMRGGAVGARLGPDEWDELIVPIGGWENVRWHMADRGDQFAVYKSLPGGHDGRKIERQRWVSRGNKHGEAVPGESAHCRVALIGPRLAAGQQRPVGVVVGWIGPPGIVAGMEAPLAIERDDGLAVADEIEAGWAGRSSLSVGLGDSILALKNGNLEAREKQQAGEAYKPAANLSVRRHQYDFAVLRG